MDYVNQDHEKIKYEELLRKAREEAERMEQERKKTENDRVRRFKLYTNDKPFNEMLDEFQPDWIDLDLIEPRAQPWLWDGMIPLEQITLLAGAGGIGKSTFITFLIEKIVNGTEFSFINKNYILPKGHVILLSAEEDEDTSLKPNLIAAGITDFSKIHPINSMLNPVQGTKKFLQLDTQLQILEAKILSLQNRGQKVRLIAIDPITYFIGETKGHLHKEVSNFILSLKAIAKRYELAIIFTKHLRKKSKTNITNILDDVEGSAAWITTPRQNFGFIEHPTEEGKILVFNMKVNIKAKERKAYAYKIEQVITKYKGKESKGLKLNWYQAMEDIDINSVGSEQSYNESKERQAQKFIYNYLKENGRIRTQELISAASKLQISQRTCERAITYLFREQSILRYGKTNNTCYELKNGWDGNKK